MSRINHRELPVPMEDVIPMNGPLFYLENGFVCKDGRIFQKMATGLFTERSVSNGQVRLAGMRQVDGDGVVSEMPNIPRIFAKGGRTTINAIIGYYWIEKKSLQDILDNKLVCAKKFTYNEGDSIDYTCLEWMTKRDQDSNRAKKSELKGNGINAKIQKKKELELFPVSELDITEFERYNEKYYVKKDGTMVIEIIDDKYRSLNIYTKHDSYLHVKLDKEWRLNRLMAYVFHDEIPEGYHVDHIDGNILNNHINNLEIVTPKENTIRGGTSTTIYKIDPSTKKSVETIRSIKEYCEKNYPDNFVLMAKMFSQRIDSGEVFEGFIWSTKENANITVSEAAEIVQKKILSMIYDDETLENIGIIPSETKIDQNYDITEIIKDIDPRGLGNPDRIEYCNNICETSQLHGKCLVCVSYHGTTDQYQLFLCKKTLTVMMISRDNLINKDGRSLCKLCDFKTKGPSNDHPVWWMPVYTYKPWRKDKSKSYVGTELLIDLMKSSDPLAVKKALKQTIQKNYAKTNEPLYPKINDLTLSFKKSETRDDTIDHHWFIANRMKSPLFQHAFS